MKKEIDWFDTIRLIATERYEQLTKHNRSIHNDVLQNSDYQLSTAAAALTIRDEHLADLTDNDKVELLMPEGWNEEIWLKMINKPFKERCIISCALTAAEVDRLNYIENEA